MEIVSTQVWCSEERCGLEMQTEKLSAQYIVFKAGKLCEVTQGMTIGQEKRAKYLIDEIHLESHFSSQL